MSEEEVARLQLTPILGAPRVEALLRTVRVLQLCHLKGNVAITPMSERGYVVVLDPIKESP